MRQTKLKQDDRSRANLEAQLRRIDKHLAEKGKRLLGTWFNLAGVCYYNILMLLPLTQVPDRGHYVLF